MWKLKSHILNGKSHIMSGNDITLDVQSLVEHTFKFEVYYDEG